jgi:hypothetical protein
MKQEWVAVCKSSMEKTVFEKLVEKICLDHPTMDLLETVFAEKYPLFTFSANTEDSYELIKDIQRCQDIQFIESNKGGHSKML